MQAQITSAKPAIQAMAAVTSATVPIQPVVQASLAEVITTRLIGAIVITAAVRLVTVTLPHPAAVVHSVALRQAAIRLHQADQAKAEVLQVDAVINS